jgi:CRP-like cAMP-binding protein
VRASNEDPRLATLAARGDMPLKRKLSCVVQLSASEAAYLSDLQSQPFHIKRGTEFAPEGTTSRTAFIVQSGWACSYKHSREGGRQITSFPLPGDFMGLGSILLRSSHHSFAALSDIVVSSFSVSSMMGLFEKFPRVAAAILWAASRDEAMLIEHLVNVGRRSAVDRVAHCLLELRQRLQLVGLASETEFGCPLTQYDLADALGLSPIHVNRVLRQLREQDLLTLKSHTAIFHNIAGLIRLAGYDHGYLDQAAEKAPSMRSNTCRAEVS